MTRKKQTAPKEQTEFLPPKWLWAALLLGFAAVTILPFLIPRTSYFIFDSEPLFYAFCGLVIPFLLVVLSRMLGFILKKPEDYWRKHEAIPPQNAEDGK